MATDTNRIVVGVDGSPCSLEALGWALGEAKRTGDHVDVLLVWSDPWSIAGPGSLTAAGKERVAELEAMVRSLVHEAVAEHDAGAVSVSAHLAAGHAAEVLIEQSADARLLVLGTTGVTGLKRWMLGSVSQRCAQMAKVPLVLVPLVLKDAED